MTMVRVRLGIMRLHIALLALVIPDLSRVLPLATLLWLFTPRRATAFYAGLSEQQIVMLIARHLRNPWRMRGRRCLRVGLLSFYFLRLAGIPAQLQFGVYTTGGPRELAHCWITMNGRCLTPPPRDAFVPILTWAEPDGGGRTAARGSQELNPPLEGEGETIAPTSADAA